MPSKANSISRSCFTVKIPFKFSINSTSVPAFPSTSTSPQNSLTSILNLFPKETFDGIWAEAVLLHLKRKDVPKALKIFHKILKKNGILYFQVKKGKGEAYVKEKLSAWNERFYTYFSKKELENKSSGQSLQKQQMWRSVSSKRNTN